MSGRPQALFESFVAGRDGHSWHFIGLQRVLRAETPEGVPGLLAAVEDEVAAGRHAVGLVAYEAAAGLDPALPAGRAGVLPPACFGIFAERTGVTAGALRAAGDCRLLEPLPAWDEARYAAAFAAVRDEIAGGGSYQVNLTLRALFRFSGEPFALYRQLCAAQPAAYCAWLEFAGLALASASPELFFARRGRQLTMRPMKGTAPRGRDEGEDRHRREALLASAKERAENLMIVDLVRNDLGRVAETGSVVVTGLFGVESYPTVHQMTSTVTARLRDGIGLVELFRALFPCGSVTGAPKRRSMEIIARLEEAPRGAYCGAIGYVSPGEEAVFSVAIRTAVLDPARGSGELGIGSGVTADAEAAAEYRECLDKAAFLARGAEPLRLVETLLWEPGRGYALLERHLRRLAESADALGFASPVEALRCRLAAAVPGATGPCKVRLLLERDGGCGVTAEPLPPRGVSPGPLRVALAARRVDSREPLLRHKTTWRPWYDGILASHPGCVDVLFCNERDEVTEGTLHNLVVEMNGRLVTPPAVCGLLPGTLRGELLARGVIEEEALTRQELFAARRLWLINSVRGWRRVTLAA